MGIYSDSNKEYINYMEVKKEPEKEVPKAEEDPLKKQGAAATAPPAADVQAKTEEKKKKKKKKKPKSTILMCFLWPCVPCFVFEETNLLFSEKDETKKEEGEKTAATVTGEEEKKPGPAEEKKEKLSFDRKLDNSVFRKLGNWKEGEYKQT